MKWGDYMKPKLSLEQKSNLFLIEMVLFIILIMSYGSMLEVKNGLLLWVGLFLIPSITIETLVIKFMCKRNKKNIDVDCVKQEK